MTPPRRSAENSSETNHDHSETQLVDTGSSTRAVGYRQTGARAPSDHCAQDRVRNRAFDAECGDLSSPGSSCRSLLSAVEWSALSSLTASVAWFEVFENVLLSFMLSGIGWNIAAGYDLVAAGAVPIGLVLTTVLLATLFSYETVLGATTTSSTVEQHEALDTDSTEQTR